LKDLAGAEVTLSQFKGKVVIVDFWATWCPPCRAEMPFYVNLYKRLANRGLVIVGISLDAQGPGVVKKFVDSNGITYPIVMGDEDVTAAYKVELMPSTFVVDREGRIRHSKIGAVSNEAEFERLIESYL
jgi:thiol-disulfide isomerase/thioredoxin